MACALLKASSMVPLRFRLVDTTLREGAQATGVYFSRSDCLRIALELQRAGIDEIEVGFAPGPEVGALVEQVRREAPGLSIGLWCRALRRDVQACVGLEPDSVAVALPCSDMHLSRRLGRDRRWALAEVSRLVDAAGPVAVSLGLEDASRADPGFLGEVCAEAARAGVARLRFADTVGVLSPRQAQELVAMGLERFGPNVGLHAHNDFGMATANVIAAIEAGAGWVDVSVLGLGERAGIARLEEVVAYATLVWGGDRFAVSALPSVARLVSERSGRPITPHRPVVGSGLFECETGVHVDGLLKDPATYEPYDPSRVGAADRRLHLGAKSGRAAVKAALTALGVEPPGGDGLDALVAAVRAEGRRRGAPVQAHEVTAL